MKPEKGEGKKNRISITGAKAAAILRQELVNAKGENNAQREAVQKVFVSVGTHPQQFDRLLREVDRLAGTGKLSGRVFAQSGVSTYMPKNYQCTPFLPISEFNERIRECDIFITHAGEGNIGIAKNMGKKMICVPRKKEYGEHTNDHQLEICDVVSHTGMGLVALSSAEIEDRLCELPDFNPAKVPRGNICDLLSDYVKRELGW
ncbi:MAG TPA: hypothetical protein HA254_02890 [Candidatus Diapherotrites archaeon]|uniref:Glycosyl transferase family 28 C-terminal domain-containing protein n=1 Tax=Candidatus Iainarchaeum sp. TaxID=3101447 RepID=A0A7J4IZ75_9ARCH|nr:hypothetical protein [Candidatus Diapherotrites archaeon]